MDAQSSQLAHGIAWILKRSDRGLWHWQRAGACDPSIGFARLSDCLADAQANGYEPALHLLRLEPGPR